MRHVAIPLLLFAHAVVGIVSGIFAADRPAISSTIFLGVIFCQTTLVGMWAGLGTTHWALRLVGLAAGSVLLAAGLGLGIDELGYEVFYITVLPSLLVALTTWVVRLFKGTVQRVQSGQVPPREALRFTIRHLLILTTVVAGLTALGKILAPMISGLGQLSELTVFALCYVSIALTSVWAMLGSGHPWFRSIFVVAIAVAAGSIAGYVARHYFVFWLSTALLEALLVVASLGVFRGLGYRFVAKSASSLPD